MKAGIKNIISLMINIAIVVITVLAISKFFVGTGDANMQISGWSSMRYFTNLSNCFAALASVLCIVFNIMNIRYDSNVFPKWVFLIKFMATVSVTVTFLTCVFFLGPTNIFAFAPYGVSPWRAYIFIFFGNALYLHLVTPLLAIISVLFFESTDSFTKKEASFAVITVFLYALVYIYEVAIVGAENGGWRDFYGFTFGGKMYLAPLSGAVMLLATLLISKTEWKIWSKVNKHEQ